jgi:ATP-dependent helicase/nuclease subunit A
MKQPTLFDALPDAPPAPADQDARDFAVNPANNVVLEASAGTGKTRVLVERYVRLILAGVEPANILAITFTRKAAAEMRDRILEALTRRAAEGALTPDHWRRIRERIADIQISTIDAFCFALLREFPLEAGVDPSFDVADETEMARFAGEALELTMRAVRGLVAADEDVRLLLAEVKAPVLQDALASMLDRRHVALPAIAAFVGRRRGPATAAEAGEAFIGRLRDAIADPAVRRALVDDGPSGAAGFRWVAADLQRLAAGSPFESAGAVQHLRRRFERYFLTKAGAPRKKISRPITSRDFANDAAKRRHEDAVARVAPDVHEALARLDADVNRLLARGLLRVVGIASDVYERLLVDHALLDFAAMLERAVALVGRQEEFARSRLKLQARYHHLLVDEFQDTSRLQWRLIELLVQAWGEGEGAADAPTSIFVVGDRKQSIYRFRHAEVTLLDEAAVRIAALRPGSAPRRAITTSFRAVPELLAFVNALGAAMEGDPALPDRFRYTDADRFPAPDVSPGARRDGEPVLGLIAAESMEAAAATVATEISRLIGQVPVRDRDGPARPARPDDIAILFRARAGHQYFEDALAARGVRTYVYKGLGFFDAPEVQDLQALLRYLAAPDSNLRAAELLRSRLVRLSDVGLARLAPAIGAALAPDPPAGIDARLDPIDRDALVKLRAGLARWLPLADRVPPSELLDAILRESAYMLELRGPRLEQARENLKKVRGLVRRVENRGYATLGRLAAYFDTLRAGEESNAIIEAAGAVNLMTMHAAKGLEFPIVFLVNMHMGGRGRPPGFSVIERGVDGEPEVAFHTTEGTALEDRRETEELRRLLYVAVTRARDRLYLGAEVDANGRMKRQGKCLGSLLPTSLAELFESAARGPDTDVVMWKAPAATFDFRVCRPIPASRPIAQSAPTPAARADVPPVVVEGPMVVAATSGVQSGEPAVASAGGPPGDRLLGSLVHRLFQRVNGELAEDELRALAGELVRPEERVDVPDIDALVARAASTYVNFRDRADVRVLLESGSALYEVPFSFSAPDRPGEVIRGVVDCLVVGRDGSLTVLEFKTGRPRPGHEAQAALYGAAVREAFGEKNVVVRVLYG